MITLKDGTILRNLEEQVLENKEQIAKHWNVDRILADFGIKMLGRFDSYDDIKDFDEGENYGNAYLIGTEEPYDVYVWTRADVNAGQPVPYWLDIGPISLVGPQGPEGPEGPQGIQGTSSKWISANISPYSADQYNLNDQWLNTSNGNVYELRLNPANGEKYWQNIGNIMGPQGPRGSQGIQGIPGPKGEPGPQGERGDVGGFINIWGILTQSSQLPTPSSLNNMTVAYLVGTTMPYDLWVQVGENSATAIWQNTGPFNAATAVSVNGVYQNVWNADTKVDKNTVSSNGIYGKSAGNEYFYSISQGTTGDTIARRTNYGGVKCVTQNADDATNKKYVDNLSVTPYILNLSGDISVSVIIPTAISLYAEMVIRVYNAGYTSTDNLYPIHGFATDNTIIVGMYSTDGQTLIVVTSDATEIECESGYPLARL